MISRWSEYLQVGILTLKKCKEREQSKIMQYGGVLRKLDDGKILAGFGTNTQGEGAAEPCGQTRKAR